MGKEGNYKIVFHDQTEFNGNNGTHVDFWQKINEEDALYLNSQSFPISQDPYGDFEIADRDGTVVFSVKDLEVYRRSIR